jgi:hypothetical protein
MLPVSGPDPSRAAMTERINASLRAGTGHAAASFALCNVDAVVDFYDGHQTPELIPDRLLWWHLLFELRNEGPSGMSEKGARRIAAARGELLALRERFESDSHSLARRVVAARDREEAALLRAQSHELSNRVDRQSYAAAGRSFDAMQKELSADDRTIFAAWLRSHRRSAVIVRFDFPRIADWECRGTQR